MSRKRLNPFEKEFLIRQFRENSSLKLRHFCEVKLISGFGSSCSMWYSG